MTDGRNEYESLGQFWNDYAVSTRVGVAQYTVVQFGDRAELADELAAQVVAGNKRATTSLLRELTQSGRPLPKPGDFAVVVDGKNLPRCIVQIREVDIKPLRDVDESFAWDEGGGDRSLEWWRSAHTRYFKRQGADEGFAVDDATVVVLERFDVVWPDDIADPR